MTQRIAEGSAIVTFDAGTVIREDVSRHPTPK
jgi:hypothetical protein